MFRATPLGVGLKELIANCADIYRATVENV
jgi:hypothetical protein